MSKDELANLYSPPLSAETLRKLLNVRYFEQLEPLGYQKNSKLLSPCVIRKFFEIYGKPLKVEHEN